MPWNRPTVVALAAVAFVTLALYPAEAPEPAGRPGVRVFEAYGLDLAQGERYEAPFDVAQGFASLNLSYQFDVAIHPQVWWRDPAGRAYHAEVDGDELDLEVAWPPGGLWSFHIQPDPERAGSRIQGGDVQVLGFLPTAATGKGPADTGS